MKRAVGEGVRGPGLASAMGQKGSGMIDIISILVCSPLGESVLVRNLRSETLDAG